MFAIVLISISVKEKKIVVENIRVQKIAPSKYKRMCVYVEKKKTK